MGKARHGLASGNVRRKVVGVRQARRGRGQGSLAATAAKSRKIVIVGDIVVERSLYQGRRPTPESRGIGALLKVELGGAHRIFRLVNAATRQTPPWEDNTKVIVTFGLKLPKLKRTTVLDTFALWRPTGPDKNQTWRVAQSLGYGGSRNGGEPRKLTPAGGQQDADVVVIDDAALDLRHEANKGAWPAVGRAQVVYKMSTPKEPGPLWNYVVGSAEAARRPTAVVNADDLRAMEVRITKAISWERTALELVRELQANPVLRGLRRCRNLVVRFDLQGAMHVVFERGRIIDARLFYEPEAREGLRPKQIQGGVIGFSTCFVSGLALHMDADGNPGAIAAGIQTGLGAACELNKLGHGPAERSPAFPLSSLAKALLCRERPLPVATVPTKPKDATEPTKPKEATEDSLTDEMVETWSILGDSRAVGVVKQEPLFGLAQRLAQKGLRTLWDVPREVVESFVTLDRSEIEGIRAVAQLIETYRDKDNGETPLSVGVFGPPGAGKSFAVKQLAKKLLGTKPLLFNLSQFNGPADLIGALHQVRDAVLAHTLPLVFWDEFDSKTYFWLQYLLAPMQDGRFQEGQLSHPIGKCVFVFAGGTSYTFATFGRFDGTDAESKTDAFRLAKGPDFKSRLSGYLDVLGPNRREIYQENAAKEADRWVADPSDIAFPLRRALMLRGVLRAEGNTELDFDKGLLGAMLEVCKYEHGSRSLEKVAYFLKNHGAESAYRRSDLPAPALLDVHVNSKELFHLAKRTLPVSRLAADLGAVVHKSYLEDAKRATYQEDFEKLPPQIQADNFAAAERMSGVLESIGLKLTEPSDPACLSGDDLKKAIEAKIDTLAAAEHDGWQQFKVNCGWRYGPRHKPEARELQELQHNSLMPYERLSEEDKNKDRKAVRNYVEILKLGGWAVARV
jgi:hypothetical protein